MKAEKKVILIKADGAPRVELLPEKKPTLWQMQAWVGGYIEPIHVRFEGHRAVMVVNEEGRGKSLPHNHEASRIASIPIVGDVFILIGWRL